MEIWTNFTQMKKTKLSVYVHLPEVTDRTENREISAEIPNPGPTGIICSDVLGGYQARLA